MFDVFDSFSPNTGKYRPEKTPYLDTFHAVFSTQKLFSDYLNRCQVDLDGLFRMGFFEAPHEWGGRAKRSPSLKSVTDILQWWSTWHTPWVLLTLAFFQRKSANFATSRNTDKDCIISNSFNFFKVFKDFFNKHGYNFDDVSKNGYLGLLKAEVF